MKWNKKIHSVFFLAIISLFILIDSSYSAQDSNTPKSLKKTKYTEVDYFDINYPKTIKINNTEYSYINDNVKWVHELYIKKNFSAVQKYISELLSSKDMLDSRKLSSLYSALSTITDDKHIGLMHNVLNEWCDKAPNSHIPRLVRGGFYINWGWSIRGTAFAKDVPKEAWSMFYAKLEMAKKDLDKSFELNPKDPNSSNYLLTVAKAMGYPEDIREQYFQNGVKACPWHFAVHFQKLESLKPKWGGSMEAMFKFANLCLEKSKQYPFLGLIMADTYEEQWYETDKKEDVLGRKDVWPQIESIYTAIIEKYPDHLPTRFSYANKAYIADKYDIALKQFEFIGDRCMEGTDWRDSFERYNSNRGYIYYKIGNELLYRKKQYKESIDYLQKAIYYKPSSQKYYYLGQAYMMLAGTAPPRDKALLLKAEDANKKALELDPNLHQARSSLAIIKAWVSSP